MMRGRFDRPESGGWRGVAILAQLVDALVVIPAATTMKGALDLADHIASVVVAVTGVGGTAWAIHHWLRRPKFICGVPPSPAERAARHHD
jgi:hypothetical protein